MRSPLAIVPCADPEKKYWEVQIQTRVGSDEVLPFQNPYPRKSVCGPGWTPGPPSGSVHGLDSQQGASK